MLRAVAISLWRMLVVVVSVAAYGAPVVVRLLLLGGHASARLVRHLSSCRHRCPARATYSDAGACLEDAPVQSRAPRGPGADTSCGEETPTAEHLVFHDCLEVPSQSQPLPQPQPQPPPEAAAPTLADAPCDGSADCEPHFSLQEVLLPPSDVSWTLSALATVEATRSCAAHVSAACGGTYMTSALRVHVPVVGVHCRPSVMS